MDQLNTLLMQLVGKKGSLVAVRFSDCQSLRPQTRDVTELSQIRIRRMRIQLFNSGRMRIRMRIYIYALLKIM